MSANRRGAAWGEPIIRRSQPGNSFRRKDEQEDQDQEEQSRGAFGHRELAFSQRANQAKMGAGHAIAMQVLMESVTNGERASTQKQQSQQCSQGCFAVQAGAGDWSLRMHERVQSSTRMKRAQRIFGDTND